MDGVGVTDDLLRQLDLCFRAGFSALTLLVCLAFLKGPSTASRTFLILVVAALLPIFALQQHFFDGGVPYAAIFAEAVLPGAIWLLVRSDLRQNIPLDVVSWGLLLGFVPAMRLIWVLSDYYGLPLIGEVSWWAGYIFLAGLIGVVVKVAAFGLKNELVDGQRLAKRKFLYVLAVGFFAGLVNQVAVGIPPYEPVDGFFWSVLFSAPLLVLVLGAANLLLNINVDGFTVFQRTTFRHPERKIVLADDKRDVDRLNAVMMEDQAFLIAGLSVPSLAKLVGVPEHRLRKLINRELGYRNFYDYLNFYRIAEAEKRLSDPELRRTSVLSISMDVGYRSIASFNKAFKERTGQTPTEYRRAVLEETAA